MTMVEIGQIKCKEGSEVIVFGTKGRADDLAEDSGTISYELLSGLSSRISRKVVE
jgi:alanine racemase